MTTNDTMCIFVASFALAQEFRRRRLPVTGIAQNFAGEKNRPRLHRTWPADPSNTGRGVAVVMGLEFTAGQS